MSNVMEEKLEIVKFCNTLYNSPNRYVNKRAIYIEKVAFLVLSEMVKKWDAPSFSKEDIDSFIDFVFEVD